MILPRPLQTDSRQSSSTHPRTSIDIPDHESLPRIAPPLILDSIRSQECPLNICRPRTGRTEGHPIVPVGIPILEEEGLPWTTPAGELQQHAQAIPDILENIDILVDTWWWVCARHTSEKFDVTRAVVDTFSVSHGLLDSCVDTYRKRHDGRTQGRVVDKI